MLSVEAPNRNTYNITLSQVSPTKWRGTLQTNGFPATGIYLYKISGKNLSGKTGNSIWQGQSFHYLQNSTNRKVVVAPNPIRPSSGTPTPFILPKRSKS